MLHTYLKDERLALVGISMGTRIFHKLLIEERAENPESQLDIAAIINCAPALVVVERIFMDMGLKFPLHMTVDGFLEVFRRTNPKYYAELMHTLTGSKPGIKDIPPMLVQIYDLLQGVEIEDIKANAARYPTAVVVGERDTVGQPTMWSDIPDVITKIIPKRGHGIALKTREGADSVTSMLDLLDARGNPFTRAEAS
jgi:alpha-beta hydrolase superfamily lysophospholipase